MEDITAPLVAAVSDSIRHEFNALVARVSLPDVYACAVMIDSGYSSVTVCIGDKRSLEQIVAEQHLARSDEIAEKAWTPSEWPLTSYELTDSSTEKLSDGFQALYERCRGIYGDDYFDEYKNKATACLIEGFRLAGVGRLRDEPPMYQFVFSTDGSSIDLEDFSSSKLNPPSVHEEFLHRWESRLWFYPSF